MKILEVVESYNIKLTQIGEDTYRGFCPFHDDIRTPNFTVYMQTDSWFCYTCNVGGDAFDFIALVENISKGEAVKQYGDKNTLEKVLASLDEEKSEVDCSLSLNFEVSNISRRFLLSNPERADSVLEIMKELDGRLASFVTLNESVKLLEGFKNRLTELGREEK